ncbi:MAG TPA: hypothetical protein VGM78_02110 [Ilumatobacteraceae bacterium]
MSPTARRWLLIVAGAALAWYLVICLAWAFRPLTDAQFVGNNPVKGTPVAQTVACNTLFAGTPRSKPLPDLKKISPNTPQGVTAANLTKYPGLATWGGYVYTRTACVSVQRQARVLFGIDTGAFLIVIGAISAVAIRLRRREVEPPLPKPTMATAAA